MKRWLGPVKHPFVSNKDPAKTGRTIYYPDWTSSITEHELGRFIDTGTRAETTQPVATDKLSWVTASAAAEWLKGIPCESLKRVCPFPRHVISCPLHIWRSRFVSPDRPTVVHPRALMLLQTVPRPGHPSPSHLSGIRVPEMVRIYQHLSHLLPDILSRPGGFDLLLICVILHLLRGFAKK